MATRSMLALSLIPISLSCGSHAFAESLANYYSVTRVRVDQSGLGFVKFDQPLTGSPATCATGTHESHLSFNTNTPAGQAIMSIALVALASDKPVYAKGTGGCDHYNVVEGWKIGWVRK